MPSVSLIITCHNQHQYLRQILQLLENYRNQLAETEVIVVDSSDCDYTLPDFVQGYRVLNWGPSAARNYGALKATGEWLLFCDADDFINPHLFSNIEKFYGYDAIFFDFKKAVDDEIAEAASTFFQKVQFPQHLSFYSINDSFYFLKKFFPVHTVLLKRSIFENHRFREEQWFIEDVRLWLELSKSSGLKLYYCRNEAYCSFHRYFNGRISLSGSNDRAYWKAICENYDYVAENVQLSFRTKLELVKLVIVNYHVVDNYLKPMLLEQNKRIWGWFAGFPRLFRYNVIYLLLIRFNRVLK